MGKCDQEAMKRAIGNEKIKEKEISWSKSGTKYSDSRSKKTTLISSETSQPKGNYGPEEKWETES